MSASSGKISIHHIGGRWGNEPFPYPARFKGDFSSTLYDADKNAAEGMMAVKPDAKVVTACLAGVDGPQTLYVTANAGGTSILQPSPQAGLGRYETVLGLDFECPASYRVAETLQLDATTLDRLLASDESISSPDFLSLDTQGSEFYILGGARGAMDKTLGVIAEVLFVDLYKDQKSFCEIQALLDSMGFEFIRFYHLQGFNGPLAPLGFRGYGNHSYADALFLKRPAASLGTNQLRKLSFIAIVFGCVEMAIECWTLMGKENIASKTTEYGRFLSDLSTAFFESRAIFPPRFSTAVPEDRVEKFAGSQPDEWIEFFHLPLRNDTDHLSALRELMLPQPTAFEIVLTSYGFGDLAEHVSLMRRDQAYKTLKLYGKV